MEGFAGRNFSVLKLFALKPLKNFANILIHEESITRNSYHNRHRLFEHFNFPFASA